MSKTCVGTLKSDEQYPLRAAGKYRNSGRSAVQYCSFVIVQTRYGARRDTPRRNQPSITLQNRDVAPACKLRRPRVRICHKFTLSPPRATIRHPRGVMTLRWHGHRNLIRRCRLIDQGERNEVESTGRSEYAVADPRESSPSGTRRVTERDFASDHFTGGGGLNTQWWFRCQSGLAKSRGEGAAKIHACRRRERAGGELMCHRREPRRRGFITQTYRLRQCSSR